MTKKLWEKHQGDEFTKVSNYKEAVCLGCMEENGVKILVDSYSIDHLQGANVDYIESLMGSGFKINNPNVKKSCSCGSSFSTGV